MINIHYYAQDPETGIIYRTVGYTYLNELIVYPKYIPDLDGSRGQKLIKYKGINYPNGSVKFLANSGFSESSAVKIKFNSLFHTFLPMAKKSELVLYNPTKRLLDRIKENSKKGALLKNLVFDLSEASGVKIDNFGLDASMLTGMDNEESDIDLVVYGKRNAKLVRTFWENMKNNNKYLMTKPGDNAEAIIKRRMSYSPLMTEEEIIIWEECKISGYFKGIKFSVMPIDSEGKYQCQYLPTSQFSGIRVNLKEDEILCDPGVLDLKKHEVEILYGPPNCSITQFITFLPSRMGIFLRKGDRLFIIGKIYATTQGDGKTNFALTQFPWDDKSYLGESYFVAKKEKCNLTHMIPALLGLDFNSSHFTE
ncbi:hypothetical protein KBI33_04200 [Candidatus Shapirobacteria bacterium]|nr:hypothetical protein [Candidatus Shapirobacteria bacterium]